MYRDGLHCTPGICLWQIYVYGFAWARTSNAETLRTAFNSHFQACSVRQQLHAERDTAVAVEGGEGIAGAERRHAILHVHHAAHVLVAV